jgi:hypothetical protein
MSKPQSLYRVHPGVLLVQKWVAELKQRTGRSLEEWTALVQKAGPKEEKARRAWLKSEHGLGTNYAGTIVEQISGKGVETGSPDAYLAAAEGYVDGMFSGGKAPLRPLYERLLRIALAVGPDVKACPCQTIVPLYRKHVFAQIKPATQTRIDMGFALGARPAKGRLMDTGGFAKKDRITHRIPISTAADIDDEVKRWLRLAYEEDV